MRHALVVCACTSNQTPLELALLLILDHTTSNLLSVFSCDAPELHGQPSWKRVATIAQLYHT